jgi:hypothetical protein
MIIPIDPGQGPCPDLAAGSRPEKGFRIVGSRRDSAPRHEAVDQPCSCADRHAVPDDRSPNRSSGIDPDASQDAVGGFEASRRLSDEDTQPMIEIPAPFRKGSGARERFERRAEEIARAAEIGERLLMEDKADLLPPFVEEGLPEMRHQAGLAGRDPREESRRQDADAGVEERTWSVDPERRDSVPFGLKRRVVLRVPVFRDQERRGTPRVAMPGGEAGEVRGDGGVGVDDQKIPSAQERRCVAQSAGGPENLGLFEKRELRKIRRLMAQVALDLMAQVMEINRYFADAGLLKPPEMR